jgi:hypothetical protein
MIHYGVGLYAGICGSRRREHARAGAQVLLGTWYVGLVYCDTIFCCGNDDEQRQGYGGVCGVCGRQWLLQKHLASV